MATIARSGSPMFVLLESHGELGLSFPGMGQDSTFEMNLEPNHIDSWVTRVSATCCGVNLAFAGFGGLGSWVVVFSRSGGVRFKTGDPFRKQRS
jgi:hypothetical protein